MSKLTTLILFSILFQITLTQQSDFSELVYEYIKDIFEGIAEDKMNSKCLQIINNKKEEFMGHIRPIVNSLNDEQKLFNNFVEHGLKLLTIHGFAKNCKILNAIIFYNKLTNKNEIINLGNEVINEKEQIAGVFNKTVDPSTENSIFYKLGKLAKMLLNINIK